jgi:hypothetical protein
MVQGIVTAFVPTAANWTIGSITAGADGNLWFADSALPRRAPCADGQ